MSFYSSTVLADSPVRYYRLNEASGATITDSSTAEQDGTLSGSVSYTQAGLLNMDPDGSFYFPDAGYIDIPTTGLATGANPWSFEAWVKMPDTITTDYRAIFQFGTFGGGNDAGVRLAYGGGGGAVFAIYDAGFTFSVTGGQAVIGGETFHLVATYDGTTISLYVNAQLVASTTYTFAIIEDVAWIGNDDFGDNWLGYLDEVAFYNVTLTAEQIATHYMAALYPGVPIVGLTVTTVGRNLWRDGALGADNPTITYFAWGNDNTPPSVDDMLLGNERGRKAVTGQSAGSATGQGFVDVYIGPGDAVGEDIEEVGVFGGSSASASGSTGVMIGRGLYAHNPKLNTEAIILRLMLQF